MISLRELVGFIKKDIKAYKGQVRSKGNLIIADNLPFGYCLASRCSELSGIRFDRITDSIAVAVPDGTPSLRDVLDKCSGRSDAQNADDLPGRVQKRVEDVFRGLPAKHLGNTLEQRATVWSRSLEVELANPKGRLRNYY